MNPKARINAVKAHLYASGVSLTDLKRELEQWFRTKGLSKSQSTAFASRAFAPDEISEIDFGATLKLDDKGDESGAMLDESRRDAGEAEELESAAKALQQSLRDESISREVSETKVDQDDEFIESLKTLEESLIAINIQSRWKRLATA
jgi:hypothetical protein